MSSLEIACARFVLFCEIQDEEAGAVNGPARDSRGRARQISEQNRA
jgi:hypothetical protein